MSAAAGAAVVLPGVARGQRAGSAAGAAFRPLGAPDGPHAFGRAEIETLGALVEAILPASDTPGAREAGVHLYLDDAAAAEPEFERGVREGLRRLDERCRGAFGRTFAEATESERERVLAAMSGEADSASGADADKAFFRLIKARTIEGYYRSEAGQMGELQWVGHEFFDAFPGACGHADPLVHPRPRFDSARPASTRGERG